MIIYQATKKEFINDCKQRRIADADTREDHLDTG